MTPDAAIDAIRAAAVPGRAAEMAAYHRVPRTYIGTANPAIDALTRSWRADLTLPKRISLADGLWRTDIHEGRIAAAKLLTQARIRPDDAAAWDLIASWVPQFDAWAIADHASIAGQKRLTADPARIDGLEVWTRADHLWTRRAVLVMTLPWTKQNHPSPADLAIRDRVLGWAADYVPDPDWFIQKSVAWWLRDLSRHDADRTRAFLAEYGDRMTPFARREAARHLPGSG